MTYSETNAESAEVAMQGNISLPAFFNGPAIPDHTLGIYKFVAAGKTYLTEGYVTVETESLLVSCRWFDAGTYRSPDGYSQPRPTEEHTSLDYEENEDDALEAALQWQREMLEKRGVVFPIWRR